MDEIRWICIQENARPWFVERTLAYTRKESIKLLIGEGTTTWRQCREKYGWRCVKVKLTITEI